MTTRPAHRPEGDPQRCYCWTNDPKIPYVHHLGAHQFDEIRSNEAELIRKVIV